MAVRSNPYSTYAGWPNAGTAALIAKEVFEERKP